MLLILKIWWHLISVKLISVFYSWTQYIICFLINNSTDILCCKNYSSNLYQCKILWECQINQLSISYYYLYSAELSSLTLIKKKLITINIFYYLIIKFHINSESQKLTNVSYQKLVKDHVIVFINNIIEVSRILLSSINDIINQIHVIWIDLNMLKSKNISRLMLISRRYVCQALLWLKENNLLYKNIEINLKEMIQ